ncbi:MAG: SipW-dependent-type signal peptide-containing protein [Lachnospiraceae bacterium]
MKKKKKIAVILAIAAVSVLGASVTLALLTDVTEAKTNTFASSQKIDILLREPQWDGYQFKDIPGGDGTSANPTIKDAALENLGVNRAKEYLPGEIIQKDPQVKNSLDGVSVYTALKVEYYGMDTIKPITAAVFQADYLQPNGLVINDQWERIADSTPTSTSEYYLYKNILKKGEDTSKTPLFSKVPIKLDILTNDGKLPRFEIKVTAYAVQSEHLGNTPEQSMQEAKKQLLKLAGYK